MGERLFLLRRRALGDVVLTGSVAAAWPGPVTVVTEERFAGLVAQFQGVREVVAWTDRVSIRHRPGRVVDLGGRRSALAHEWMLGRPVRALRKHTLRRRAWLHGAWSRRPPVVELYGRAVGVRPLEGGWWPIARRPQILVLAPGAAWAPKRWPVGHFVSLAERVGMPVEVIGGPGDEEVVQALSGRLGVVGHVDEGFGLTREVLERAAVLVSGDTAWMHLAGAASIPAVALFGPTHPDDGFCSYPTHRVVHRELGCRPCTLHRQQGCPLGHHRCMVDLEVERVAEAVRRCTGS